MCTTYVGEMCSVLLYQMYGTLIKGTKTALQAVFGVIFISSRVSNNPGDPGNLLEFIVLLEFYWNFVKSPGNSLHIY